MTPIQPPSPLQSSSPRHSALIQSGNGKQPYWFLFAEWWLPNINPAEGNPTSMHTQAYSHNSLYRWSSSFHLKRNYLTIVVSHCTLLCETVWTKHLKKVVSGALHRICDKRLFSLFDMRRFIQTSLMHHLHWTCFIHWGRSSRKAVGLQ